MFLQHSILEIFVFSPCGNGNDKLKTIIDSAMQHLLSLALGAACNARVTINDGRVQYSFWLFLILWKRDRKARDTQKIDQHNR